MWCLVSYVSTSRQTRSDMDAVCRDRCAWICWHDLNSTLFVPMWTSCPSSDLPIPTPFGPKGPPEVRLIIKVVENSRFVSQVCPTSD